MPEPTIEITSFHAHVYYDTVRRETAARMRQELGDRFNVQLGRWHDKLVASPLTPVDMKAFYQDVKSRMTKYGREPEECKILPAVVPFVGETEAIAHERLEAIFRSRGADGFVISHAYIPGAFEDFVDLVVPELQRRGLFRQEYIGGTLREHLGLKLPR